MFQKKATTPTTVQRRSPRARKPAPVSKVAAVDGDMLYVSGGRTFGYRTGMWVKVVKPSVQVSHPDTGEVIGEYHTQVGYAQVLQAGEKMTVLQMEEDEDALEGSLGFTEADPARRVSPSIGDLVFRLTQEEEKLFGEEEPVIEEPTKQTVFSYPPLNLKPTPYPSLEQMKGLTNGF